MADDKIEFRIKGKDESKKAFASLGSSLKSTVTMTLKLGTVIAGLQGSIYGIVSANASAINSQDNFSQRVGYSITELTKYQHAANVAGIETSQFNMSIQRATRRVAEAANGTGEAVNALRELNINAREFNNLPLGERLEILSDRFEDVENGSDKLRLAFKLFDSEGASMIQMLNGGSEAIQEMAADAEFLGIALSESAAKDAAIFSKEFDRSKKAIKGVGFAISEDLMPLFSGLTKRFADFVAENRGNISGFVSDTVKGFFFVGAVIEQLYGQLETVFGGIVEQIEKDFDKLDKKTGGVLGGVGDEVKRAAGSAGEDLKFLGRVGKSTAGVVGSSFWEIVKAPGAAILELGDWASTAFSDIAENEDISNVGPTLGERLGAAVQEAKARIAPSLEDLKSTLMGGVAESSQGVAETFGINIDEALVKAQEAMDSLSLFADESGENIKKTGEATNVYLDQIQAKQSEYMEWLRSASVSFVGTLLQTTQTAIQSLGDGMANAIVEGESLAKAFRNTMKSVVKSVISALVQLAMKRIILSTLENRFLVKSTSAKASAAVGLAGANMFASWAAAPWPLSIGAPAAAAGAVKGAAASFKTGASAGAGLGASVGAIAHGGLTNNPDEQTILVKRGERILSPRQNVDITTAVEDIRDYMRGNRPPELPGRVVSSNGVGTQKPLQDVENVLGALGRVVSSNGVSRPPELPGRVVSSNGASTQKPSQDVENVLGALREQIGQLDIPQAPDQEVAPEPQNLREVHNTFEIAGIHINMFPNVTDGANVDLRDIDTDELAYQLEDAVLKVLDNAGRRGVFPEFQDRS